MTDANPPPEIVEHARLMMVALTSYHAFDQGLTSEVELAESLSLVLAEADHRLLLTTLCHTTVQLMKENALFTGASVEDTLERMGTVIVEAEKPDNDAD